MDFYVSPVTLLFESSLISIASLTPKQQILIQTRANENKENKENRENKENKENRENKENKKEKLKKD
jgi:hypothetical protein